ncbi:MAG: hypothetical protein IK120_09740 [Muribaculaceae bacterium]|nr:hypothetical protein [Muribaculaceae bacterium]
MKKLLLSLMALAALTASAQSAKFSPVWTSVLDGAGADHAHQVVKANDGGWFIGYRFVPNGAVALDGNPLDLSESTDYATNNSYLLVRYDASGNPLWTVHSDWGYEYGNALCATSDGGALVALNVNHTYNTQQQTLLSGDTLLAIKDATNKERVLFNQYPGKTNRQGVIVKIDNEGRIDWMHPLIVKDANKSDGFTLAGVGEYNLNGKTVYGVSGSYVTDLALDKNDFGGSADIALPAGAQENIFCLTFDQNGLPTQTFNAGDNDNPYNLISIVSVPEVSKAKIIGFQFNVNPLTATVAIQASGAANSNIVIRAAGMNLATVNLSGVADELIVAKVDMPSLSLWAKVLTPTLNAQGKSDHKPQAINIVDGDIYVTGAINGGLALSTSTETNIVTSSKAALDGYVIGMNGSNGSVKGGATVGATISQLRKVIKGDNKIWAYGYQMSAGGAVEPGVFMLPVDPSSFAKGTPEHIVKSAGAPTLKDCALDENNKKFVALMGENKAGTLGDGTTLPTPTGFHAVAVCNAVNMDLNAVQSTSADDEAAEILGGVGEIIVKAENIDYNVYNPAGQLIGKISGKGEASMKVDAGIYLVGDVKVIVK